MLHKYANEDVSLGAWFLGLDAEHIDDRRLCCGTPPGNFINLGGYEIFKYVCMGLHMFGVAKVSMTIILVCFQKQMKVIQHMTYIDCYSFWLQRIIY